MCSSSECLEGLGHDGVSIWVWECVNAVNSSGDKVKKACCHIARIGLSVVVSSWRSVLEEVLGVFLIKEVRCGVRVGGSPPPSRSSCS